MDRPSLVNEEGWVHVDDLDPGVMLYRNIGLDEARWAYQQMIDVPIFSIVDVKGGVKKTTCAVHVAFALHRHEKKRVLLVDGDQYQSITDWRNAAEDRGDPWPEEIIVIRAVGDAAHFDVIDAIKEYEPDYVGWDTPPNDAAAARRALLGANVLISPSGPFAMDIRRLAYGVQIAAEVVEMRGGTIDARVALTGVKIGSNQYKVARQYISGTGLQLLGNMPIRDLGGHAENFGTSLPKMYDYEFVADDLLPIFRASMANR